MSNTSTSRRSGGYTLIELSVVMAVFAVVLAIASPFLFRQLRSGVRTESRVDVQQSARGALRVLVRELRQAKELYATTEKPTNTLAISFGVDLNGDGVLNNYRNPARVLEQITYFWDGGILYRGRTLNQAQPMAEGVTEVLSDGTTRPGVSFTMFGSHPALDTNADGVVTEDELDLNGDGAWQASELVFVTRVAVSMTVTFRDQSQTHTANVWLRNRGV